MIKKLPVKHFSLVPFIQSLLVAIASYLAFLVAANLLALFLHKLSFGNSVALIYPVAFAAGLFTLKAVHNVIFINRAIVEFIPYKRISWRHVMGYGFFGVLLAAMVFGIEHFFHLQQAQIWDAKLLNVMPLLLPLMMINLVILAPLYEEVLFRGYVFSACEKSHLPLSLTVILTALIWSVLHIQYSLAIMSLIMLIGVILAIVRYYAKNIIPSLVIHMFFNGVQLLLVMLNHS